MKKSLFALLTFCLAFAFVASPTNANAFQKISLKNVGELINLQADFSLIMLAIQGDMTYIGAADDPNPVTNEAVAGLLAANQVAVDALVVKYRNSLEKLGVPNKIANQLSTQISDFYTAAVNYILVLNLANKGNVPGNQDVAATLLVQSAVQVGTTLSLMTGSFEPVELFAETSILLTEEAQGWCGVLADGNTYGAEPSEPATETAAAVKIFIQIGELFREYHKAIAKQILH